MKMLYRCLVLLVVATFIAQPVFASANTPSSLSNEEMALIFEPDTQTAQTLSLQEMEATKGSWGFSGAIIGAFVGAVSALYTGATPAQARNAAALSAFVGFIVDNFGPNAVTQLKARYGYRINLTDARKAGKTLTILRTAYRRLVRYGHW